MFNINELTYLQHMQQLQDPSIGFEAKEEIVQWLNNAYYRRFDDATIETIAGIILQDYPQLGGATTKRYRFTTDKKTELLKNCV